MQELIHVLLIIFSVLCVIGGAVMMFFWAILGWKLLLKVWRG